MNSTDQIRCLPKFLKDFHDAKDFFKALWRWQNYNKNKSKELENHTWISQHIFVCDYLIPFLGLHGYKIIRYPIKNITKYDLNKTIESMKEEETNDLNRVLGLTPISIKDKELNNESK
jgi:hypothetical protein